MSMPPNRNLFAEFKGNNRVLVETGSFRGDGIQLALDAGYEKIISIDNDPEAIEFCMNRFDMYRNPNPAIELIPGDSADCLYDVIAPIKEPITFWLDSHWQLTEDAPMGKNPFPLMDELEQIWATGRKDNTIIIDDILYLTHPEVTGLTVPQLRSKILDIAPWYKIEFIANPVINNILVAHP